MNKNAIGLHKFSRFFFSGGMMTFGFSAHPVQIATSTLGEDRKKLISASTRPVQIATAEMHRIAICTFQNVC